MITRYFAGLALVFGLVFSTGLLLMRSQPYDDHSIRELLPGECTAPCFLGIYLGITTDTDAVERLQASPWVNADSVRLTRLAPSSSKFDDLARIQWVWSAARPDWVTADDLKPDGTINIRNHVVERIAFNTRIPAAAIYQHLGNPSILVFAPIRDFKPWSIEWVYQYATAQLVLHTEVQACPYLADLWLPPMYVQMVLQPGGENATTTREVPSINLRMVLNARKSLMCRMT